MGQMLQEIIRKLKLMHFDQIGLVINTFNTMRTKSLVMNPMRFFLMDCSAKKAISDLRNRRTKYIRLRNQNLQSMVDLSWGLGTPFNVQENPPINNLITEVAPRKSHIGEESRYSSDSWLSSHTESIGHIHPPTYVCLFCERKDRNNEGATLVADVDDIKAKLTPQEIQILSQPKFTMLIEKILNFDQGDIKLPNKVPILRDGMLFWDTNEIIPDQDAKEVFNKLKKVISQSYTRILLEEGDLLIFNNFKATHGRAPFKPLYDGKDRLLHRMLIMDPLNKYSPFWEYHKEPVEITKDFEIVTDNAKMRKLAAMSHDNLKSQLKKHARACIIDVEDFSDQAKQHIELQKIRNHFLTNKIYCETVFYKDEDCYVEEYVRENFDFCMLRKVAGIPPSFTKSKYDMMVKRIKNKMPCFEIENDKSPSVDYIQNLLNSSLEKSKVYA